MKRIILPAIFCCSFLLTKAQAPGPVTQKTASEVLLSKESSYDFGKIPQGKPVTHVFVFTNTSKDSIKLDEVRASCGCTTPEWSKEKIAPGATTTIKVGYNAYAEGPFEKTVSITYNQVQSKVITIRGAVWKTPVDAAPQNASVQLLKNINQ
jgi:hypothetical protein